MSVERISVPHIMRKHDFGMCDVNKISVNVIVIMEHIEVNLR
jgi:hypothetical protein